ncbi:MAG TPA: VOC family protein [Acidobacteriaceae bacterium]
MKMNTYINFGGNCAEAFRFYEQQLGGKVNMTMLWNQMPDADKHTPPGYGDKVLHTSIQLGGGVLMGADVPGYQPMRSAYISLHVDSVEEAERIFKTLSEGGEIYMNIGETFFAQRFAQFSDRFGTKWMLICEKPMQPQA